MTRKIICKSIEGADYETDTENLKFRPAVYGIIIKDNKILLSKQWDGYFFPGGGIELGEIIEESLKREIKEETGLDIESVSIIDCKDSFFKTPDQDTCVHSILLFYLCKITGGEISTEFLDEVEKESLQKPEWVSLDGVDKIKFMSTIDCLEILEKVKSKIME